MCVSVQILMHIIYLRFYAHKTGDDAAVADDDDDDDDDYYVDHYD